MIISSVYVLSDFPELSSRVSGRADRDKVGSQMCQAGTNSSTTHSLFFFFFALAVQECGQGKLK